MSEDRSGQHKTWLERLTDLFSDDPQSRQDIKIILREAAERAIVDSDTLNILEGALQVSEMQVRDIMIPRSQMTSIHIDEPLKDYLPKIIDSAHSRFPVMGEGPDEVIGIMLAKDLLPLILNDDREQFTLKEILRPTTFVPESKRLNVLLREFRATRNHMAIVVDEFGSVAGLVTIEDVLEQIVGEIEDEHDYDEEDSMIKEVEDGIIMVKALTPIEDFNEHFDAGFPSDEFDTIGGIVIHHFGRVPECNEHIRIDNWQFKVVNGTSRQINLLEVTATE
ncbi:MAG: magnesium/cobalt efflux protein [Oceanospirillaceae bacterium]|uniref:HlyC/CorC family transporter n=1 Tax=unclassified Thalassolituus TaxID=2624967 RepID=UPI000C0A97D9|nr:MULTISPECIES: transporter associated domain-containing protein [unclassified Thalassolituus]MAK92677.1 magnesium/cobalt efflux protein [Thalassolituus sp.]MAS26418.1 magnesium/cobalt efflux protein [Oceanospirillaceae bacterium]MAX98352.1 magnesium/cobalt efflux protein [Oceanospirillaceae bacterium]MBL34702.1 magnesium/cobalt efflux protein [Oceanospirillaceae bacterium]MBS54152.1 magnesium/cobalt efflux protein [Oceanospirillaceae bacterium]|tara:strand:- start:4358 stop:5194 length:837 start_codon:yes stop_codon:yes gene_type:complete